MILTCTVGLYEAGIFTIAYADGNLFLTIGKYSMRSYQVSDVREMFSFSEFRKSRMVSVVAMLMVSAGYVLIVGNSNHYTLEKSMIIFWMCLFKAVDAIEDVYHGMFQQKGRLDIAGKELTVRMLATVTIFAVGLIVLRSLLYTLVISTVITLVIFIVLNKWCLEPFQDIPHRKSRWTRVCILMKVCLPLAAGSFLSFYINNAPKYAIDSILSDELQACYGFIAMPVFVIGLLNNFIFNPLILKMSVLWNNRELTDFMKLFVRQILIVFMITFACELGAYFLGIPVLSIMYNTNLSAYKNELLVLLVGGGFLALSGFLATVVTIIRSQQYLIIGYASAAVLAYFLCPILVRRYSIMGAALMYLALMIIVSGVFSVVLFLGLRNKKNTI